MVMNTSANSAFEIDSTLTLDADLDVEKTVLRLGVIAIEAGIHVKLSPTQRQSPGEVSLILTIDSHDMLDTRLNALADLIDHKNRNTKDIGSVISSFSRAGAQIDVGDRTIGFPESQATTEPELLNEGERNVEGCMAAINFVSSSVNISGCSDPIIFPSTLALILAKRLCQQQLKLTTTAHTNGKKTVLELTSESALYLLQRLADNFAKCVAEAQNELDGIKSNNA